MGSRFEYRIFDEDLFSKKKYLQEYFIRLNEEESSQEYLLSKKIHKYNIKIRDKKLDVKKLHLVANQFEQWDLLYKKEFPILTDEINTLFSEKLLETNQYISEFDLKNILKQESSIKLLRVDKKRVQFKKDNILGEFSVVEFDNKTFHIVALESEDLEGLKKSTRELGLEAFQNINYYKFLQDKKILNINYL